MTMYLHNSKKFTGIIFLLLAVQFSGADEQHPYNENINPPKYNPAEENKLYWYNTAQNELEKALNMTWNTNVAKNVILFIGDGMSMATVTAARIYEGQNRGETGEEGFLVFDRFPHIGLSKTYNTGRQVPDSAGTATAYLCGTKTRMGTIGVDGRVKRLQCETMTNETIVDSIAKWSQDKGKRTGVVTTTRITHATPAALYAHSPEREWECDAFIPEGTYERCPFFKDIARQLVEDEPGRNFNVIMGGGFQELNANAEDLPGDSVDILDCVRRDNRSLSTEWIEDKTSKGKTAAFARNKTDLDAIDLVNTEYVMGLFANSHIPYEYSIRESNKNVPTLAQMTEAAIKVLSQGPEGFFLLVEGGRIDQSHHNTKAKIALDETIGLNNAVAMAMELTSEEDTLIVVTADHSHTMTIGGYAPRGTDITGIAGLGRDLLPYTTLSYANGDGYNYTVEGDRVVRGDLTHVNTSDWNFLQQTLVPRNSETHGGDDVIIYASGPMAHLFHSVHEQNYIAHALAFASCVDPREDHCATKHRL